MAGLQTLAAGGLALSLAACGGGGAEGTSDSGLPVDIQLSAFPTSSTTVQLSWSHAASPDAYLVYVDGSSYTWLWTATDGRSTEVSSLRPDTRYCFRVYAASALFGHFTQESQSNEVCVRTPADRPPGAPQNVAATAMSPVRIDIAWSPAADDWGVARYAVYRDGAAIGTSGPQPGFSDASLLPEHTYCYAVEAVDSAGQVSPRSAEACAATPADAAAPTTPTAVTVVLLESGGTISATIDWSPSTDDARVAGYQVFRNGALLRSTATPGVVDSGLSAFTQYCYAVAAYDIVGKLSDTSAPVCLMTSWTTVNVVDVDFGAASLAVDADGRAHIGYTIRKSTGPQAWSTGVGYASNVSGSWQRSDVVPVQAGDAFSGPDIAVDSNRVVHLCYREERLQSGNPGGALLHATSADGWAPQRIDALLNITDCAIALDPAGHLHAIYHEWTGTAYHATNAAGAWARETMESGTYWAHESLAIDAAGHVHAAYWDLGQRDLRYIANVSGAWAATALDSTDDVGAYAAIAVDPAGQVHIAYRDETRSALKYASNTGGAWTTTTVDDSGDVGTHAAIAVDPLGKVHIAYVDRATSAIRYASNASGAWTTYILGPGHVGWETSIAIDGRGRIHLTYVNFAGVMYATALAPGEQQ